MPGNKIILYTVIPGFVHNFQHGQYVSKTVRVPGVVLFSMIGSNALLVANLCVGQYGSYLVYDAVFTYAMLQASNVQVCNRYQLMLNACDRKLS